MALKLEVFETAQEPSEKAIVVLDALALEDSKLAAYDQGYSAGWEDATTAQSDDQTRMRADLARNLQSLGFTYHEARTHVLRAVEPLLQQVVCRLLPALARESLAPVVLEVLMPLVEKLADAPISLVVNPASRAAVETLLAAATNLPITIVEEPSLSEGQAYLRLGSTETHIDLDGATAEISTAMRGFFESPEREPNDR